MNHSSQLSNVTKDYLDSYYRILDEMIRGMTNVILTDSISNNFILQMIPHHRAAIEMSQNILKYTTNIPLQTIATGIIKEQTKSIADMQAIQHFCGRLCNCERDLQLYQRKTDHIINTMFERMENARSTNNINADFMWEMIPHHMGAVEMSKNALQYDICQDLKPILNAIITSQEKGIRQMTQLLGSIRC